MTKQKHEEKKQKHKKQKSNNKAKIVCDDNCDVSNVIEYSTFKVDMQLQKIINILYKHMKYDIKCVLAK